MTGQQPGVSVVAETLLNDAAAAVQLLQEHGLNNNTTDKYDDQHDESAISNTATTTTSSNDSNQKLKPPDPLPMHWVLRESRSQPGYYYYFNFENGICSWQPPYNPNASSTTTSSTTTGKLSSTSSVTSAISNIPKQQQYSLEEIGNLSAAVVAAANNSNFETATGNSTISNDTSSSNNHKRPLPSETTNSNKRSNIATNSTKTKPTEVRVIHILKKHKGSRKPSSWRVPHITATKEEAYQELHALLDVLREVQDDPAELRATMEELARTESDCSSYKRNGDLGYFTTKKMQPQFEDVAFALQINELSDIVETSSGLHILLRIG